MGKARNRRVKEQRKVIPLMESSGTIFEAHRGVALENGVKAAGKEGMFRATSSGALLTLQEDVIRRQETSEQVKRALIEDPTISYEQVRDALREGFAVHGLWSRERGWLR